MPCSHPPSGSSLPQKAILQIRRETPIAPKRDEEGRIPVSGPDSSLLIPTASDLNHTIQDGGSPRREVRSTNTLRPATGTGNGLPIQPQDQTMFAIIFLTIGAVFSWLIYQAVTTREILARGWGVSTRTYSRDNEPAWYWVTLICYSICAVVALIMGILLMVGKSGAVD